MTKARPRSFFVLQEIRKKARLVPFEVEPKTGDRVATLRVFFYVRDGYGQVHAFPSLFPDPSGELSEMAREVRVGAKEVKRRWKQGDLLRGEQMDEVEIRLVLQQFANDLAGVMDALAGRGLAIEIVGGPEPPVDRASPDEDQRSPAD